MWGAEEPWITSRGYRHCKHCGAETAVTAGTLFEGTTKALREFFKAIWLITGRGYETSALDLKRVLRLGSYQAAWTWHHKIRRAMGSAERDRLSGAVEVQLALLGPQEGNVHDREAKDRVIIAVAAERRGRKIGRIRLRRITEKSTETLAFVENAVTPGSSVRTDDSPDYSGLDRLGYYHKIINVKPSGTAADKRLPRVREVVFQLEKWLRTTHRNGVQHRLYGLLPG